MTLTEERQRVKAVLKEWDIVSEVLTTPIVYHPGGWEDTVPEELRREVLKQRIEKVVNGGWDEATDAEALCYLMTASLVQPLSSDWTQIFLYEGAEFMSQVREAIPDIPKELSDYQRSELRDLKRKIRDSQKRRRKSNRKEKGMGKRKLVLEEHENNVLVGIMQEGCDPIVTTKEGSIEEVLPAVPDFLTEAQEKWAVSPKNPAYKAPAAAKAKVTPAAATTPAQKAEDLPLLSGTEKPAEEQAEESIDKSTTRATLEAQPETAAEITEPPAAPAETAEPEPEVPAVGAEEAPAEVAVVGEEKTAMSRMAEQEISERIAQAPAPAAAESAPSAAAKPGEWDYYLQDGRGPYGSVQLAMDALDLDKNTRPTHNRWDRLSTALKEKIQRRAR